MTKFPTSRGTSRRSVLAGLGTAALTGIAMPNLLLGRAKAQDKYKLDLGGYNGPELTSQPITLRFMRQDFTPEVNALLEKAYAEFSAAYPNITVVEEKVPYGDLQKKMVVYVASGDAPDIMMGRTDFAEAYHAGSLAAPLQEFFTADYLADIPDNLRLGASSHGNLYCVPWETNISMLYFNKDLFEKAGVEHPPEVDSIEGGWTVDQYLESLEALTLNLRAAGDADSWGLAAATQGNGGPGSNYSQVESSWIRGNGDPAADPQSSSFRTLAGVSPDGASVTGYIDTPEAIEGMQKYQSLFTKGLTPRGAVPNQYLNGVAATHIGGLNYVNRFRVPGSEPPFRWGVTAPPKGKIVYSCASSDSPMVWSKTPHLPEAVALMAFLCNDANRLAFHGGWGSMASRLSLQQSLPNRDEQGVRLGISLANNSVSVPRTAGYFDYYNAMNPAVKDIALGSDPAKVLPETAVRIDRLLAKYR